ncbi:MAG: glycosyltransferase [Bacteroidia bacterium]
MPRRLKIAFITSLDPNDKRSWSGISYYTKKALEKHCGDVYVLKIKNPFLILFYGKIKSYLTQKILRKRYNYKHSIILSKKYGKLFSEVLNKNKYDIVFAPAASTEMAFVKTTIPIVNLSDTTFFNMINYYPAFSNLLQISKKEGMEIEQRSLSQSSLLLYPSYWAAKSAIADYKIHPSKIHVIPLGANLEKIPTVEVLLKKQKAATCRLLFLGVNWNRKGGDIAFDTLLHLEKKGIQTELTICGCIPPPNIIHRNIKVIPFINKNEVGGQQQFFDLLLNSDFLLLPTRAECYGIVFCEASAFGLPSITTNTGGIESAIKNTKNGFLLPLNAGGVEYANIIMDNYCDDEKYYSLIKSTRKVFDTELNWDNWSIKVKEILEKYFSE